MNVAVNLDADSDRARRPIVLIGARCVGKTTVGGLLARELGLGFIDLDDAVAWAASEGCCAAHVPTVAHVVEQLGWDGFRELERAELARVLADGAPRVIATGGGAIENAANRALLRERAFCVWLRNDVAVLQERMRRDATTRPSLTGADPVAELEAVLLRREPWYAEVAHARVECGSSDPKSIAEHVARLRFER